MNQPIAQGFQSVGHQDGASAPTRRPHSPHPYAMDI